MVPRSFRRLWLRRGGARAKHGMLTPLSHNLRFGTGLTGNMANGMDGKRAGTTQRPITPLMRVPRAARKRTHQPASTVRMQMSTTITHRGTVGKPKNGRRSPRNRPQPTTRLAQPRAVRPAAVAGGARRHGGEDRNRTLLPPNRLLLHHPPRIATQAGE